MASPEILDFSRLLAPISDSQPTGPALRSDSALSNAFYEIRDASKAARDAERRAVMYSSLGEDERQDEAPPDPPNWRAVVEPSLEVLAEKSKDLWIAAWMIEGLVREHGFVGLRDGFRLVRELCERFWGDLHPRPDEEDGEDITATLSQLSSLNEILIASIERISITEPTPSFPAMSSANYKDASNRAGEAEFTLEMFDSAVREGSPDFYRNLLEDIEAASNEFTRLDQMWDEKCGKDEDGMSLAPATSNIKKVIAECRDRVRSLAKHILQADQEDEGDGQSDEGGTGLVAVDRSGAGGPSIAQVVVRTREDALRALLKVADFFKRTEPHSPLSYKLEEAVRWGRLTLPELMEELMRDLVTDDTTRHEMFRRAGIVPTESPESE